MYKFLSIFLSVYLLMGSALLPKGDFSFSSQVAKLYDEFVQVNGSASFDEFLEEELLEPFSLPEDGTNEEPFEKECHPVPIDLITVNASITFYTLAPIIEVQPEPKPAVVYIPYTENFTSTDLDAVFHPPRPSSYS
ncbi:MAG: hypothetical protein NTW31_12560 [Bacteroidetes bacterium]|nr:hypothetical protein [Bacteroidota bacterium]